MSVITTNLESVLYHMDAAARRAARVPEHIQLLAVSKTCSPEAVIEAARAGQLAFGENYEQEAIEKMEKIREMAPELKLEWHYIGGIQSNKTRTLAEHFDWVHSVDRERIAQRLSDQRPEELLPLNICIQVNISGENSKSGCHSDAVQALATRISRLPRLKLRGLMAIPEPEEDLQKQKEPFRQMKALYDRLNALGLNMDTLSMGMTADMDAAIAEGATIVRIGTAIFGARN